MFSLKNGLKIVMHLTYLCVVYMVSNDENKLIIRILGVEISEHIKIYSG
jgi:hypothetical protein